LYRRRASQPDACIFNRKDLCTQPPDGRNGWFLISRVLARHPRRPFWSSRALGGLWESALTGLRVHHLSPPCLSHLVGGEMAEPIVGWRGRARYVRSILNIRTALNRGQPGSSSDWRVVWPGSAPKKRSVAAAALGIVVSTFLSEMNVQPILQCVDERLTITFVGGKFPTLLKAMARSKGIAPWLSSSGTLLAEIAVRTALALQEGAGWEICSNPECQRLYRPRRHVAEGRLHFCNDCGKRASWRLSKRRKSASVSQ